MVEKTYKRSKGSLTGLCGAVFWTMGALFAVLTAGCGGGGKPLEFVVLFEDAKGLRVGDLFVLKGIAIGEVKEVGFDQDGKIAVRLRVDDAYRDKVMLPAAFLIDGPGMLDLTGQRQVVIEPEPHATEPVQPGMTLEGADSRLELYLAEGRKRIDHAKQAGEDTVQSLRSKWRNMFDDSVDRDREQPAP